jgi:hypothetical protein
MGRLAYTHVVHGESTRSMEYLVISLRDQKRQLLDNRKTQVRSL